MEIFAELGEMMTKSNSGGFLFFFLFLMTCRYRIAPVDISEIPASGTVDYDHVQNKNKDSQPNGDFLLVVAKG